MFVWIAGSSGRPRFVTQAPSLAPEARMSWRDMAVSPATRYEYRVSVASRSGPIADLRVVVVTPSARFGLQSARPNPSRTAFEVAYTLETLAPVTLEVLDLRGARVRTLVAGAQGAGEHTAVWDGADAHGRRLGSGVYFLRLISGVRISVQRAVLLR